MQQVIDIVKRDGRRPTEAFERAKLERSIQAACRSVRCPDGQAELLAQRVSAAVTAWLEKKSAVTSSDLRRQASRNLAIHHPEAAYFYEHHRIIL